MKTHAIAVALTVFGFTGTAYANSADLLAASQACALIALAERANEHNNQRYAGKKGYPKKIVDTYHYERLESVVKRSNLELEKCRKTDLDNNVLRILSGSLG